MLDLPDEAEGGRSVVAGYKAILKINEWIIVHFGCHFEDGMAQIDVDLFRRQHEDNKPGRRLAKLGENQIEPGRVETFQVGRVQSGQPVESKLVPAQG